MIEKAEQLSRDMLEYQIFESLTHVADSRNRPWIANELQGHEDPIVADCRLPPAPNIGVSLFTKIGKVGNEDRSAQRQIKRCGRKNNQHAD